MPQKPGVGRSLRQGPGLGSAGSLGCPEPAGGPRGPAVGTAAPIPVLGSDSHRGVVALKDADFNVKNDDQAFSA